MSTNKTSEAVDRIESDVNLIERKAIAEKYKRMEEALQEYAKYDVGSGDIAREAREALAFDPLSPL